MSPPISSQTPYTIQETPYGGRGAFASIPLEKDTLVLACAGPYASVILRKFRKEACAWCFSYAFESGRNSWSVRVDGSGARFCQEDCKEKWLVDEHRSGIRVAVNTALDKTLKRKNSKKPGKEGQNAGLDVPPSLHYLYTLKSEDVATELLDRTWTIAEQAYDKATFSNVVEPNEYELDTAQFILDGLCRRALEEASIDQAALNEKQTLPHTSSGTWTDMLRLQVNERPLICEQPTMLTSQIRVYGIVRQVIANLRQVVPMKGDRDMLLDQLVDLLQRYTMTSDAVRALLARDHGNVFGIWDKSAEESEMLGWGMYVFGSYFNHDCSPNLVKKCSARTMYFRTTRPVSPGQELCINYVDVGESTTAIERYNELKKGWFFSCCCPRCQREFEACAQRT